MRIKKSQYAMVKLLYTLAQRYARLAEADQDNWQLQRSAINSYRDYAQLAKLYHLNSDALAKRLSRAQ